MSHTTAILTKPPPGLVTTDSKLAVVNVVWHPSDDPVVAARQAEKINKLTDRILKVGNLGLDDDE